MNKIYSFIFSVVLTSALQAQSVNISFQGTAFGDAYDKYGTPLTEINKYDFDGTPYLNDNWSKGGVRMKSGMAISDIDLKLDLYSNRLLFRKNDTVFLFANPVSEFSLIYPENAGAKRVFFRCGYPEVAANTSSTFYQVLADGSKLHLIKYVCKVLADELNYGGPVRKEYQQRELLYIYDTEKAILIPANKSRSALIKSLPSYSQQIQSYLDKHKLSREEDFAELVNYINQS